MLLKLEIYVMSNKNCLDREIINNTAEECLSLLFQH